MNVNFFLRKACSLFPSPPSALGAKPILSRTAHSMFLSYFLLPSFFLEAPETVNDFFFFLSHSKNQTHPFFCEFFPFSSVELPILIVHNTHTEKGQVQYCFCFLVLVSAFSVNFISMWSVPGENAFSSHPPSCVIFFY